MLLIFFLLLLGIDARPFKDANHDGVPDLPLIKIEYDNMKIQFENNGTLDGWDRSHKEKDGTITQESGECFDENGDCLKFAQKYDPNYRGRYHTECVVTQAARNGRSGFYAFAFKIPENFEFDDHNTYSISQFITSFRYIYFSFFRSPDKFI
jgi:Polysaccharide lyase